MRKERDNMSDSQKQTSTTVYPNHEIRLWQKEREEKFTTNCLDKYVSVLLRRGQRTDQGTFNTTLSPINRPCTRTVPNA